MSLVNILFHLVLALCKQFKFNFKFSLTNTGKSKRNVFYKKQQYYETHKIESEEKQSRNETKRPRFTLSRTSSISFQPEQYICIEKYSLECKNKTEIFRDKVLSELKKVSSENFEESNYYNVTFNKKYENLSSECLVLNAGIRTLKKKDVSFVDLEKFIPKRKLFRKKDNIRSCVVISSAGSLIGSQLGKFIGKLKPIRHQTVLNQKIIFFQQIYMTSS